MNVVLSKGIRITAVPVLFLYKVYCICFYESPKFALKLIIKKILNLSK